MSVLLQIGIISSGIRDKMRILAQLIVLMIVPVFMFGQVDDATNYSVISEPLSVLTDATGWSMQDNGKWASERNTIPYSDSKTVRHPTPKHKLGMDNFLELDFRKVLIDDKQYNVLVKIYRDGEYEFPLLEEGWKSYNSAEFYVFPADNLMDVLAKEVVFDEPYTVNLNVFCYGSIKNYNPYLLTDKIVSRINNTLNSTYVNAANLVFAVWPIRDEDSEVVKFKLIKTFNKQSITNYYLDKNNIEKAFAASYFETYFYRFKEFIRDAQMYNLPIESAPSDYVSYYRWGVLKYQAGNFDGAIEDFNKAIASNPNTQDFMIFSYRGNAKTKLRDFNGAIDDFDRALEIQPSKVVDYSNWIRNYYNRGVAKFYINDLNAACEDWHKAFELGFGLSLEYLNKYCQ